MSFELYYLSELLACTQTLRSLSTDHKQPKTILCNKLSYLEDILRVSYGNANFQVQVSGSIGPTTSVKDRLYNLFEKIRTQVRFA